MLYNICVKRIYVLSYSIAIYFMADNWLKEISSFFRHEQYTQLEFCLIWAMNIIHICI